METDIKKLYIAIVLKQQKEEPSSLLSRDSRGNTEREIVEASKPDPTPLPKVFQ